MKNLYSRMPLHVLQHVEIFRKRHLTHDVKAEPLEVLVGNNRLTSRLRDYLLEFFCVCFHLDLVVP